MWKKTDKMRHQYAQNMHRQNAIRMKNNEKLLNFWSNCKAKNYMKNEFCRLPTRFMTVTCSIQLSGNLWTIQVALFFIKWLAFFIEYSKWYKKWIATELEKMIFIINNRYTKLNLWWVSIVLNVFEKRGIRLVDQIY